MSLIIYSIVYTLKYLSVDVKYNWYFKFKSVKILRKFNNKKTEMVNEVIQ